MFHAGQAAGGIDDRQRIAVGFAQRSPGSWQIGHSLQIAMLALQGSHHLCMRSSAEQMIVSAPSREGEDCQEDTEVKEAAAEAPLWPTPCSGAAAAANGCAAGACRCREPSEWPDGSGSESRPKLAASASTRSSTAMMSAHTAHQHAAPQSLCRRHAACTRCSLHAVHMGNQPDASSFTKQELEHCWHQPVQDMISHMHAAVTYGDLPDFQT